VITRLLRHVPVSPATCLLKLEDVESVEHYCPGRFHPITIGDHLHGPYRIVHKLGFGAYSTVWLAKDERADRYVAIKIAIAGDR
jgi:serine/threonine-protein kinase SRPK3